MWPVWANRMLNKLVWKAKLDGHDPTTQCYPHAWLYYRSNSTWKLFCVFPANGSTRFTKYLTNPSPQSSLNQTRHEHKQVNGFFNFACLVYNRSTAIHLCTEYCIVQTFIPFWDFLGIIDPFGRFRNTSGKFPSLILQMTCSFCDIFVQCNDRFQLRSTRDASLSSCTPYTFQHPAQCTRSSILNNVYDADNTLTIYKI